MQRLLDFLRFSDLPLMTRPNYAAELKQVALWGVVIGAVEGSIASIVASKTFHASRTITAVVWALPAVMNLLNLLWATLVRGRPRVRTTIVVTLAALVSVTSIAFTPARWEYAAVVFAVQIGCTHLFLCALTTLRTTMWQMNYPATHRARITGRLTTVRVILGLLTVFFLTNLFDRHPDDYRWAYPLVAILGGLSLVPLTRIRVRGEKAELHSYHARAPASRSAHPLHALRAGLRESLEILRQDRLFAQYMGAQFLLGSANFFTEPLLINAVTKRFAFGYFESALLITVIPTLTLLIGIRYWAPLFDRIGVLQFRIINSTMWLLSYVGTTAAMLITSVGGAEWLPVTVAMLALARVGTGLGSGGGTLAWNLGHLAFARPHQTELYMGIHVALTGVRALIMPFLGLLAMRSWGDGAFAVSIVLALAAHALFKRMQVADKPFQYQQ